MIINRNTLGHLEVPAFVLMKASGERVGVLQCTAKKWTKKYNDLDVLTFELPYMTDATPTPFYSDIDIMKYVEVPSIGTFAIKSINTVNEGQTNEFKKVECQSRECELGQRYLEEFSINNGTTASIDGVKLYDPADQTHSLLHLVITEKCPNWTIGHVSQDLRSKQRSFEVTRQDIYSFLMSDIMEAFECIILFDSTNRTISVYKENEYGQDTNLSISYNNLLQNTSMDYSIDDIKTCLTLKGDGDLDVREVAMGYDRIYSFGAFASREYWSSSLLNAYNAWQNLMQSAINVNDSAYQWQNGVITKAELSGKNYEEAFSYLLNKYQNYYTELSGWYNTKLPYGVNTRKNPGYGTISYTEDGSDKVVIEKQTATVLVDTLPSSKNTYTLYIMNDDIMYHMYRWTGSEWIDVNEWHDIALAELKSLQSSAEKLMSTAMKAGYGDADSTDTNIQKRYIDTYLPAYYMYNALDIAIILANSEISTIESAQAIIEHDKNVISEKTSMKSNFTTAQLKELSSFIREEELTSSNYVVTDSMTESERFEMLYDLLDYGEKELAKKSTPQIQFSANLINLFAIPEFDSYSGDFDIGNYVWVTVRDDYSIKAKILEITINFLDQSEFNVTFGNVVRRARNMFTDVTNALNAATTAATSVSFGASHWSAAARETDAIGDALKKGLLSQQYYLSNAEDNEILMDDTGLWITTTTGEHGKTEHDNYDAIYLGGGRILYTDDGWRSVSMSVGRGDVDFPSINSSGKLVYTTTSMFGVFADYLIAGYVGGSIIAGGDIYSANYQTSSSKTSGNKGTHINLTDGTFEFNSKTSGKKRLTLSDDTLEVFGTIQASKGHIGCDDNGSGGFIIDSNKMYNNKSTLTANANGVYVGNDGIGLGQTTQYPGETVSRSKFQVDSNGNLYSSNAVISGKITASSGTIGGFNIASSSLWNGKEGLNKDTQNGVYLGTDGIALGTSNGFKVTNVGYLTSSYGKIGGFTIDTTKLYNSKSSIDANSNGVYLGNDGIGLGSTTSYDGVSGSKSKFHVDKNGNLYAASAHISGKIIATSGKIGGATIASNSISASDNKWYIKSDGSAKFGGFSIDSSGNTYYNSSSTNPFDGTCVTHIKSISAEYIYAQYIQGLSARIADIEADYITTGQLNAVKADIDDLEADNVTINNTLTAQSGEIIDLKTVNLEVVDKLNAHTGKISTLEADNVTITGRLTSLGEIVANKIDADYITSDLIVGKLDGKDCNVNGIEIHGYLRLADYLASWHQITINGQTIRYVGR